MLVSTDWLKEHINDSNLVILDTRPKTMFLYGHLPKAKLIPFTEGIGYDGKLFHDKESLLELFTQNNVSKNKDIACYCMHGHRASGLFFTIKNCRI